MTRRFTYEEVKEYIESFGYKLLSEEYINLKSELIFECPNGHKYKTKFGIFQRGYRCPHCSGNAKHTIEHIKEYIESYNYELLSDKYTNNHAKLKVKCPENHEYEVTFKDFKRGRRCPYCSNHIKYTYNEIKKYIESFNYELLSEDYKNNKEKIFLKCSNGHIFEMCYSHFKNRGQRCPICNVSKGEQKIMDWLNKNNIKYIYDEPYFNDLLSPLGNPLRPDFIIKDKRIWIEYDGEFHFEEQFKGDSFEMIQEYDEIKNQYAKENNWKLIRIPYWEFDNIEEILKREIKKSI